MRTRQLLILFALFLLWSALNGQTSPNTVPVVKEYYSEPIEDAFPYPDSSYMSIELMFDEGYEEPPRPGRITTSATRAVKSFNELIAQWDELTRKNPTIYMETWDEQANLQNQFWIVVDDETHQIHYIKRYGPTGQYEYLSTNYTARQSWRELGIYEIRHTMWELGPNSHIAIAYNEELKSYGFELVCNDKLKESIAAPLGLYRVY